MKKVVLASLLFLQGCASVSPTHFYNLEANLSITPSQRSEHLNQADKKPLIGIAQISLPSVLERKQIVTRDAQGKLNLSEQNQWATLLKQNMTEVLAKNLAMRNTEFWFKAYPWSLLGMVDYRLVIDVTRLDIVLGKTIDFSIDWTLLNEKTHTVLKHNSIDLTQPLADSDYSTAVLGLNQLLSQLSEKLNCRDDRVSKR